MQSSQRGAQHIVGTQQVMGSPPPSFPPVSGLILPGPLAPSTSLLREDLRGNTWQAFQFPGRYDAAVLRAKYIKIQLSSSRLVLSLPEASCGHPAYLQPWWGSLLALIPGNSPTILTLSVSDLKHQQHSPPGPSPAARWGLRWEEMMSVSPGQDGGVKPQPELNGQPPRGRGQLYKLSGPRDLCRFQLRFPTICSACYKYYIYNQEHMCSVVKYISKC